MKIKLIFSDPELAQLLSDSKPPLGIKISKPKTFIECEAPGEILRMILIQFIPRFSATFLAGWILLQIGKHSNKRTRINDKDVTLKKRDILRLVQKEIAKHHACKSKRKRNK
jgi:hypothetical protein